MNTCPPPRSAKVYVEILGVDDAIAFFLEFGGAEIWLSAEGSEKGRVAKVIGVEKASRLAGAFVALRTRVPIPNRWIAQVLREKGLPDAEIARTLHTTDVTLRRWRKAADARAQPEHDTRQLPLL